MNSINLIQPNGTRVSLDIENGESVMLAAVTQKITGILGECGGSLACATCHVSIDKPWFDLLKPATEHENEMLDATATERGPTSRLACQVVMAEALTGMVVRLPEAQI